MTKKKIKVCYIAGREYHYTRTRTVILALESAGIEYTACLPPNKRFRHYPRLLWQFIWKKRGCDAIILGFYGALLMPLIRLFTRKPILFDIHSGTHETMLDWERAREKSFIAEIYYWLDHFTMNLANGILLESMDHIRNWSEFYKVPEDKFYHVFLSADNTVLFPKPKPREWQNRFLVHFHGEFAPFHGVEHILRAAYLLKKEGVEFQIIGFGTTYQRDMALAKELNLTNCHFIRWVPYEELADVMCRADVCLGFFGDRKRAYEVFTNKVVEAIGVKRPLITMKNEPVQELLKDGESVLMVPPGDSKALAQAILKLKNDPELYRQINEFGHEVFLKHCTVQAFGRKLKVIIENLLLK